MSLLPNMFSLRVKEKIHPPDSVSMELGDDGILRLAGTATMGWILRARQDALLIPGINGVDVSGIRDPGAEYLQNLVAQVESAVVRFPLGKDTPIPEDAPALAKAVDTLVEIETLAKKMGMTVGLTIYGHADLVGSEKRNYELSQARARTLAAMLYARGSSLPVTMYGMGAEYAQDTSSLTGNLESRRIEMRVLLTRSAPPGEELVAR
jgi:outer membrane protein OmpA-like peptidoglycan-associated protein